MAVFETLLDRKDEQPERVKNDWSEKLFTKSLEVSIYLSHGELHTEWKLVVFLPTVPKPKDLRIRIPNTQPEARSK